MALEKRKNSMPIEKRKRRKKRVVSCSPSVKNREGKINKNAPKNHDRPSLKAIQEENSQVELPNSDIRENMSNGQNNILVAVRVRPLLRKENEYGTKDIVRILDKRVVVVLDPGVDSDDVLRINRSREKRYAFDYAFDGNTSQEEVFDNTASFLLDDVLNGFNATVFAYGATGSGKTFTMLGSDKKPGLMFLTLQNLFKKAEQIEGKEYRIMLSYIEIYNETIQDLLNPSDTEVLELREDSIKGVKVVGVTEYQANSAEEVMTLLRRGNRNRTQEPTNMNEESSRSHAVLQVLVEQREHTRDTTETIRIGKLSLIDLAGSERAAVSQNRGIRLLEGANINRSLLALGNCINALGDKNKKGSYVPYRDSKLTRLLKDSLGGNCRTVMIATIAPCHTTIEDSINTLKYANRAKNIKTKVTRNVLRVSHHITQYHKIIADLRTEITELKHKLMNASEVSADSSQKASTVAPNDQIQFDVFQNLRRNLVSNFDEKMYIRQTILEIEAQERQNRILCSSQQIEISTYESAENQSDETPRIIAKARKELSTLMQNMKKNTELLEEKEEKLKELEKQAKIIRKDLQKLAVTREMQDILELLYRSHVLELENLELISQSNSTNNQLKEKDLQIQKLELQLQLRDKIIRDERSLLTEHGIPYPEGEEYKLLLFHPSVPTKALNVGVEPAKRFNEIDTSGSGLFEEVQRAYNNRRVLVDRETQLKRLHNHLQTSSTSKARKGFRKPIAGSSFLDGEEAACIPTIGGELPRLRGTYPLSSSHSSINLVKKQSHQQIELPLLKRANSSNKTEARVVAPLTKKVGSKQQIALSSSPIIFSKRLPHASRKTTSRVC